VKYLIVIGIFLTSISANANECKSWEYAALSYTASTIILEDDKEEYSYFVMFHPPGEQEIWQDNKLKMGFSNKTLKEYFKIKSLHHVAILNSLGNQGWEAYGYYVNRPTKSDVTQSWQFKRCKA